MIETTKSAVQNTINQAVERAKAANSAFRTHDDVAVALPGGLFGHVRNGRLVSFGLEPVGAGDDRRLEGRRRVLARTHDAPAVCQDLHRPSKVLASDSHSA